MKRKWNSEQTLIEQVVDEVALDCIAVDFPQSTLEPQNIFEPPTLILDQEGSWIG